MKSLLITACLGAGALGAETSPYDFPYGYPFPDYPLGGASDPKASHDYMSAPPKAQHIKRFGQYALRLIQTDRAREALDFTENHLEKQPEVAHELLYMNALARARLDDADGAAKAMRRAVEEAGLPPGRFFSGPRRLFAPMADHEVFETLREKLDHGLVHGPMLGAMTADSVKVWVRTAEETPVRVMVGKTADLEDPTMVTAAVRTRTEDDHTAEIPVRGLAADTVYHYVVLVGEDQVPVRGETFRFRTFPEKSASAKFDLVFGGCAGYVPRNERIWDTIRERDPRAVLTLGDNVYIDDPESPDQQRYCYAQRQSRPEFRRMTASASIYAIWDDHDFAMDDSSGGPLPDVPYWKPMVTDIFKQNWVDPGYAGDEGTPGLWFDFHIGDVHFIMLDGRSYRVDAGRLGGGGAEKPTMLGPVQLAWLEKTLARSEATFRVLVSPVSWHDGAKPGRGGLDTWKGYADERAEIFSWIDQYDLEGVFLLSSDRHRSDAYRHEREDGYDLYEFASGQFTNLHTHGIMEASLFGYNEKPSFGLLNFDTAGDDPSVTYRIVNIDGEEIQHLRVRRADMK